MNERELKLMISEKSMEIAKIIYKGNDCEIRKSPNGISIIEVNKRVVSK